MSYEITAEDYERDNIRLVDQAIELRDKLNVALAALCAAQIRGSGLQEQLQHMTLRINSLERSSFTGMS